MGLLTAFVLLCRTALAFSLDDFNAPPPTEGTYRCYKAPHDPQQRPQGKFLRGYCLYRAHTYGDEAFLSLLQFADRRVRTTLLDSAELSDPNNLAPQRGRDPYTIEWWFEDEYSNTLMGELLKNNDLPLNVPSNPVVMLTATIYSFERAYAKNFGVDLSAFYGKLDPGSPLAPQNFVGGLSGGLFNILGSIGNPLASFLNLGVQVSRDKNKSQSMLEAVFTCEVGTYCEYKHFSTHHFKGPVSSIDENIGIKINATPRWNPADPRTVQLVGFGFQYSRLTDNENAPVDLIAPIAGNLRLQTDELYALASEQTSVDFKSGRLLGEAKGTDHTNLLMLMRSEVLGPDPAADSRRLILAKDDRSYTDEEKARLPKNRLTLNRIFNSLDLICYPDYFGAAGGRQSCGLQLQEISRETLDLIVTIEFAGRGVSDGSKLRRVRLGDLYKGKGYYRIPEVDATQPGDYAITIKLDQSTELRRKIAAPWVARENLVGVEVPIEIQPALARKVEWGGRDTIEPVRPNSTSGSND